MAKKKMTRTLAERGKVQRKQKPVPECGFSFCHNS